MNVKYSQNPGLMMKKKRIKDERGLYRATLVMTMAVLADKWNFTEEELQAYMEYCNQLMESLTDRVDDVKKIEKNLYEIYGLKIEAI